MPLNAPHLARLAGHMAQRRDAVMAAWRRAVTADPKLTSGASLPRAQLHDHIPALLEDFERLLASGATGPGLHAGPGSKVAGALVVATEQSRDLDADAISGDVTHVGSASASQQQRSTDPRPIQAGEGIGLSIVKRLCELLDATIDLDSKPDEGTTVRIHLPRRYGDH